jgi:hypothetical protein
VRNLLHDQVSLNNSGAASVLERHQAKRELKRRWHELLAHEQAFRSNQGKVAAIGSG